MGDVGTCLCCLWNKQYSQISFEFVFLKHVPLFFMGAKKKSRHNQNRIFVFWARKVANQRHSSFTSPLLPHGTFFFDQARRCDSVTARFNYQDPISSSNDLVKQFMYRPNRVGMPKSVRVWESHSESAGCGEEWIFWWVKGSLASYVSTWPQNTSCITILMECWRVSKYHSSGLASRNSWWVHPMTLIGCFLIS